MPLSPSKFQSQLSDSWLGKQRQLADPEADAVLEMVMAHEGKEEAKRLFDLLIRNIDLPVKQLPDPIQSFISKHKNLPSWADQRQLKTAYDLFVDHGPKLLVFLYYKSLPTLYACKNGAQVLMQTGRLAHPDKESTQFTRRIAETGQFLIQVMMSPDLAADRAAIHSILKVRLIHAAIRQFIPEQHWNAEALGLPINQEDLAITLMTFSISLLDALAQFEIEEPSEREQAYLHRWLVIGFILGIREELLPPDLHSARLLIQTLLQRQQAPSEAGKTLTAALIKFAEKTLPSKVLQNAPPILIRELVGPEMSSQLGVQTQLGCMSFLLPQILKSYFNWVEKLEDHSEPLQIIIDKISKELTYGMVHYFNSYKGAHFQIPNSFEQKWGVSERVN